MMPLRRTSVRAYAKLNLDLRLLGTRPDGFHELRTIFQSIELHDRLIIERRAGPFAIESDAVDLPLDGSNLVVRAAQALWTALGRKGEVRDATVHLEKRIPLQAGLGGGSADAAAALVGLTRLWGARLSPASAMDVARRLGSDVPFFLLGGTALGLGRGDALYGLEDFDRLWVVLVLPGFGVSTADAYRWYDEERARGPAPVAPVPDGSPWLVWRSLPLPMTNDLEGPVARRYPEIARAKGLLDGAGAIGSAMAGSGSTVFGLFGGRRTAEAAAQRVGRSGWKAVVSRTISRDDYRRGAGLSRVFGGRARH